MDTQTLQEMRKLVGGTTELREADEIEEKDLTPSQRKVREELAKLLKAEPGMIWQGIHGTILTFTGGELGGVRITKKVIDGLAKIRDLRWFEVHEDGNFNVGIV